MGLFAELRWVDGQWAEDAARGRNELHISVHDSDIAVVQFTPAPAGHGLFFLGFEPAEYFGDPYASQPVDHAGEAAAFASWAHAATGRVVSPDSVRALMASPGRGQPEDVFVEETLGKLLDLVGVRMPETL